jgi:PAS domain S-box-containing protein
MSDFLDILLSPDFLPHGHCFFWQPLVLWLNIIGDSAIALSYYSIPIALFYIVKKRDDLFYHWMFVLFALFIFACGTTHLLEIWNIWHGDYVVAGIVKLLTGIVSLATGVLLWRLIPHALQVPSRKQIDHAYASLRREVAARRVAQEDMINLNRKLEARMEEAVTHERLAADHFQLLANSIPQLVLAFRQDGVLDLANTSWTKFTGMTPERTKEEGWSSAVHPDEKAEVERRCREALEAKSPYQAVIRLRDSSGNFKTYELRATAHKDGSGQIARWIIIFYDSNSKP